MKLEYRKALAWFGFSTSVAFNTAVFLSATLTPSSLSGIASSGILLLGLFSSLVCFIVLRELWQELEDVSILGLLALSSPLWALTGAVIFYLRLQTPDSDYLLAYQIMAAVLAAASASAAALQTEASKIGRLTMSDPGSWRDYLMLTKPVVVLLLLVTTLSAMIIAAGSMPPASAMLLTAVGGAFSAGGASALNQYIDRERDGKMSRTQKRPIPGGRMKGPRAVAFGLLLCTAGFNILALGVNLLSAGMALVGMIYYVFFYSIILKPTTAQNIVVGGGAGAIPPLVGWAAATNSLSMPAFFLFALIFFWTPPHFWALALLKNRDYERAGVPMFPVVYGERETRIHILLYAIQLVALTLLLPLAALGRSVYLVSAVALGLGFLVHAWRLWKHGTNKLAYKMYRYSSTYLALIFAALVVDTLVAI